MAASKVEITIKPIGWALQVPLELRPVPVYSGHDVTALLLCLQRAAADAGHEITIK